MSRSIRQDIYSGGKKIGSSLRCQQPSRRAARRTRPRYRSTPRTRRRRRPLRLRRAARSDPGATLPLRTQQAAHAASTGCARTVAPLRARLFFLGLPKPTGLPFRQTFSASPISSVRGSLESIDRHRPGGSRGIAIGSFRMQRSQKGTGHHHDRGFLTAMT